MCEPECPNEAISMGDSIYEINSDRCTECVGHYDTPTCQKVCPIPNTILKDPAHVESEEQLWDKFVLMHHADKFNRPLASFRQSPWRRRSGVHQRVT